MTQDANSTAIILPALFPPILTGWLKIRTLKCQLNVASSTKSTEETFCIWYVFRQVSTAQNRFEDLIGCTNNCRINLQLPIKYFNKMSSSLTRWLFIYKMKVICAIDLIALHRIIGSHRLIASNEFW